MGRLYARWNGRIQDLGKEGMTMMKRMGITGRKVAAVGVTVMRRRRNLRQAGVLRSLLKHLDWPAKWGQGYLRWLQKGRTRFRQLKARFRRARRW